MDRYRSSTKLREEAEKEESDNLEAEEAAVGVVRKAAEKKAKEIEIKVKMGFT